MSGFNLCSFYPPHEPDRVYIPSSLIFPKQNYGKGILCIDYSSGYPFLWLQFLITPLHTDTFMEFGMFTLIGIVWVVNHDG